MNEETIVVNIDWIERVYDCGYENRMVDHRRMSGHRRIAYVKMKEENGVRRIKCTTSDQFNDDFLVVGTDILDGKKLAIDRANHHVHTPHIIRHNDIRFRKHIRSIINANV